MRTTLVSFALLATAFATSAPAAASPDCGPMEAAFVGLPAPFAAGVNIVSSADCTGAFVVAQPTGGFCHMRYEEIVAESFFAVVSPNSCTYGVVVEEQQVFEILLP